MTYLSTDGRIRFRPAREIRAGLKLLIDDLFWNVAQTDRSTGLLVCVDVYRWELGGRSTLLLPKQIRRFDVPYGLNVLVPVVE